MVAISLLDRLKWGVNSHLIKIHNKYNAFDIMQLLQNDLNNAKNDIKNRDGEILKLKFDVELAKNKMLKALEANNDAIKEKQELECTIANQRDYIASRFGYPWALWVRVRGYTRGYIPVTRTHTRSQAQFHPYPYPYPLAPLSNFGGYGYGLCIPAGIPASIPLYTRGYVPATRNHTRHQAQFHTPPYPYLLGLYPWVCIHTHTHTRGPRSAAGIHPW